MALGAVAGGRDGRGNVTWDQTTGTSPREGECGPPHFAAPPTSAPRAFPALLRLGELEA